MVLRKPQHERFAQQDRFSIRSYRLRFADSIAVNVRHDFTIPRIHDIKNSCFSVFAIAFSLQYFHVAKTAATNAKGLT
jgi:hypothetical protein